MGYFDFSNLVPIKGRAGIKSPLHIIGPLCNPLPLKYKVLSCCNKEHLRALEPILDQLCENYLLTLNPNMDEISLIEPSIIIEKRNGVKREYFFNPDEEDLPKINYDEILHPGNIILGTNKIIEALNGEDRSSRDILALNAGAGLYLVGKSPSIKQGFYDALDLIAEGKPLKKLEEWRLCQKKYGSK